MCQYKISLKAARVNAGMTQQQVADMVGRTKQTIVNWENNTSAIKYKDLERLVELYQVPLELLRI